ncbi:prepilin-type N-terminal cleavage/methylation domain-containing protein [Oculatella sp. LEGE 06141]|uniref:pilus assembly FimT family protein n=1 Tax=Oculatella sp. LEGE 06141 TaxID=1828648 RepID=UPI001880E24E|nr:GspH/FimT family pseudopilin [Oculatella sp. LEGE 06141]MBE9178808.1 prepilin-type N-terminal cleavage/methylation domain-containing protein [Oculatella sp. LEGE 06141]
MWTAKHSLRHRLKPRAIAIPIRVQGFTLIELLTVVTVVGALAAIAAPSWLAMLNAQRLNSAQDRVYQVMRQAQIEASNRSIDWEAGFRENNGIVEVATFSANTLPVHAAWTSLASGIQIDPAETTLAQTNGVYRIQFNSKGQSNGQIGRLTLQVENGGGMRRCVYVSTILGTLRKAANRPTPEADGKYCY